MQLFTPLGFRYVNCKGCATQRWSRGWLCECGVAWHTCESHRVDPCVHRSTKPPKRCDAKGKEEGDFKDSERKAPESVQSTTRTPLKKVKLDTVTHSYGGDAGSERRAATNSLSITFAEKMRKHVGGKGSQTVQHARE